jgi:hypothetical protein
MSKKAQLESLNQTSPLLAGVEIAAYPTASGPLSVFGRNLKIVFPFFAAGFKSEPVTRERKLASVVVNLSNVVCQGAVDSQRNMTGALRGHETPVVEQRTREEILDVHRFPVASFTPLHEEQYFLRGLLELHGEKHEITCTKSVEGDFFFAKCPLDMRDSKIPQHASFLGALRVDLTVDVEVRVPLQILKVQGKMQGPADAMPNIF